MCLKTLSNFLSFYYSYKMADNDSLFEKDDKTENGDNLMEEIIKKIEAGNLETTITDEKWNMLANNVTTVPKNKRIDFDKDKAKHEHSSKVFSSKDEHKEKDHSYNRTKTEESRDREHSEEHKKYSYSDTKSKYDDPRDSEHRYSERDDRDERRSSHTSHKSSGSGQYEGFDSEDDLAVAKLDVMAELSELVNVHKVRLTQKYTMNSQYKIMKAELELHKRVRAKHMGTMWLGNIFNNICWGIEMANESFNPFDFDLGGWSNQLKDEQDDYYDVFGELYEKWFKSGRTIPPELKLLFLVGGSALRFHGMKSQLGQIPDLKQALQNNPELAQQIVGHNVNDRIKTSYEQRKASEQKRMDLANDEILKRDERLKELKRREEEHNNKMRNELSKQNEMYSQQAMNQQLQQQMLQSQMMQKEIHRRQQQLDDLNNQLYMQNSDTGSSFRSYKDQNGYDRSMDTPKYNTQPQMIMPQLPSSLQNKSVLIGSNKPKAQRSSTQKSDLKSHDSAIIPNLDAVISKKIDTVDPDTVSIRSHESTRTSDTNKSKKRKRKIKVDA